MSAFARASFGERLLHRLHDGGPGMYAISALGCLLVALALAFVVVAVVSKSNRALPLSLVLLALAVLPPAIGRLAVRSRLANVERAISFAPPEDREILRMEGQSELLDLTLWGYGAAVLPSFVGCLLLGVGLSRLPRFNG